MKQILVVDNTFDPPHGSPEICSHLERAAKGKELEVIAVRGPERQIPKDLSKFHGIVLSGSKTRIAESAPWIEDEMELIRKLFEKKIPVLGICYGEQLIVKTMGGESCTGVAKNPEHGWVELTKVEDESSPILQGLPDKFYSFEFHNDEVISLPKGFQLLLSSEACAVQAYAVEGAPIWGLQFHPERGLDEGNRSLDRKLKENPSFKPINRDFADRLYKPEIAQIIFGNFLKQVWKY